MSMVRLHEDVDGCGCVRCQQVDHEVLRRSLAGALVWSATLPVHRPSILVVLTAVGLLQAASVVAPTGLAVLLVCIGVLGVFAGRGYIGIVGHDAISPAQSSPASALRTVARRFPAFVGAVVVVLLGLFSAGLVVITLVAPVITGLAPFAGVDTVVAEVTVVVCLVGIVTYTLLKSCFVPEACFVGGYGPLQAVRVSWVITRVHAAKAVTIVAGLALLLAAGALLETQLGGAGAPISLDLDLGGTTVVIRSFGFSVTSVLRFVFDLGVTALYSGVFVHQYVDGTLTVNSQ
jgi:hypothetical protein